ncbi:HPr family phosphocarrier protein [Desulfosarcina sp. OttesenSCG-928-A07]|nr:HPr family phosphocarrier protein [Desulfosarcina sp. OttesenSCG-928-G17]MDL2330229.1 HPr family phosphocarrier protein [Desulfosarcina sp. OttesenSCG-928-A07]
MSTRTITLQIVNALGLHARPAAQLAQLAGRAKGGVWIARGAEKINAGSLLDILTLGCMQGETITLSADDTADLDILEQMAGLVRSGFGEP